MPRQYASAVGHFDWSVQAFLSDVIANSPHQIHVSLSRKQNTPFFIIVDNSAMARALIDSTMLNTPRKTHAKAPKKSKNLCGFLA